LVIEEDGKRSIYDTKHHQISGISQQQGSGQSYQFTSQDGHVDLSSLSLISNIDEQKRPEMEETSETEEGKQKTPEIAYDVTHAYSSGAEVNSKSPEDIIISTIEKINILFEKGQITEEEFKSKKQELLAKL
jgi:hypothetical protein